MPVRLTAAIITALGMVTSVVGATEVQPADHAAVVGVTRYVLQVPDAEYLTYSGRFTSAFPKGLPPAYGSYRWVRYYDDVILVDLRSGYVVDVIHDFFW